MHDDDNNNGNGNNNNNNNGNTPSDSTVPDLTQFDSEFAEAPVEERNTPVPDGKYQVNVEKAQLTTARTSGNPMLKWTLRVLGPTHRGRLIWRNNVMATRENIKWFKNDLHVCGLDLGKLSDLPAHLGELLDVKLEITVRTNGPNTNVYLNRRIDLGGVDPFAGPPGGGTAGGDIPF